MHRKSLAAVLAIVALAAGGAALFVHRAPLEAAPASAVPPPVPVVGGTVASHDVPIYLRGVGTVIAYNTVVVRSQIQGQITKIAFTEGQHVQAGDLLAQIDPRPYQAERDRAAAGLAQARSQLALARSEHERATKLLAQHALRVSLVRGDVSSVCVQPFRSVRRSPGSPLATPFS